MLRVAVPSAIQRFEGLNVHGDRLEKRKYTRIHSACIVLFLAGAIINLLPAARVHAQTPNYQGKTVTIIVGTISGDLYDLYARSIALFMGKYLPGNPNIIVQNMPGAGHMIAANYIYNVAKPDGLTMGAINAGLYFEQLIGRSEVKFDWTKYAWIGNATKSPQVLYMRADSPFKTIEDVRTAKQRAAEMRHHGYEQYGLLRAEAFRRNGRRQIQRRCGLPGRERDRSRRGEGRDPVPLAQLRGVFLTRAISLLAQERFYPRARAGR